VRFSYRRPISVSSAVAVSDYEVPVVLDTASLISAGKMLSDCSDVAFSDEAGRLLRHFVEPGTCNTASTRFFVKVPSIPAGEVTIFMHYGGVEWVDVNDPYAAVLMGEDLSKYSKARLYGDAVYIYPQYIRLTSAASGRWGGIVGVGGRSPVPAPEGGLYAKIEFMFTGGSSPPADAVWIGAYDDTYVGTSEDVVAGGYHFTFDIYQSRICFTKSTAGNGAGIACYTVSITRDVWHTGEVYFWHDGSTAYAKIYYDGVLVVDASDPSPQPNALSGRGIVYIAGRTGGAYTEMRVRKYIVTKWRPEVSVLVGDEEAGDFTVVPNTVDGAVREDVLFGNMSGNTMLTVRHVDATVVSDGNMHVDEGATCRSPAYSYALYINSDRGPISGGYVYAYLSYPPVYAEGRIVNGRAFMCIPLTPEKVSQMSVVVVDDGLNVYPASITRIEEITSISDLGRAYNVYVDVRTQLVLPARFVLDLAKLVR